MMVSPVDSASPLASLYPADAVVSRDFKCVGCGYNLRTLHVDGRCPECGLNVEQSLLVLPQRDRTAAAIRLAAVGLLLSLVLACLGPFSIIGSILMLVAAYRLQYRCELSHMMDLGKRVRWWWTTLLVSTIGETLLAITEVALFVTSLFSGGPIHLELSSTYVFLPVQRVSAAAPNTIAGGVQVTTDEQGQAILLMLDTAGNVLSTDALSAGTFSVIDASGQAIQVSVDQVGTVTLTPPGGRTRTVTQGTTTTFAAATVATKDVVLMILGTVCFLFGFAAAVLCLLTCRSLAKRANAAKLARTFRTLLWLFAVGIGVIVLGVFAAETPGLLASARILVLILPMFAGMVCLLVAAIWQIVASFRLATILREAPLHWSEIAAVPGDAGTTASC